MNEMYQVNLQDDTKTVYVNSDILYFSLSQNGSYLVNYNQGFETNPIAQLMYKAVSTTKVPQDYSVSDSTNLLSSNVVSSTSRMAQLEAGGANECQDGGVYEHNCKKHKCYECTIHNDDSCCGLPSSWRTCTSYSNAGYYSNCKGVN